MWEADSNIFRNKQIDNRQEFFKEELNLGKLPVDKA